MHTYLKYWTGSECQEPRDTEFVDFPIRCYFDNDSDELINYKATNGKINIDVYRELIRSIKKMGYNAIDIHDQLGRAEFYLWDRYKRFWNYEGDINHIEALIDMIHEEGLMVQIPMYLAWAFDPIEEGNTCYSQHKGEWKEKWQEYLKSPLGKCDIFLLRPRSPIYDRKYTCECNQCSEMGAGAIMTDAFQVLEELIDVHNSDAVLICDLYAEGYELWKSGDFCVSDRWILTVADSGYGKVLEDGEIGKGPHRWGIYLHAGFWLNHTVMDPHIDALSSSMLYAYAHNATSYMLVNGQSFKNFVFNLEAIMYMARQGKSYNRFDFISDWAFRVLGMTSVKEWARFDRYIMRCEEFHRTMAYRPAYLDPVHDVDRGFIATHFLYTYALIEEVNNYNSTSPCECNRIESELEVAKARELNAIELLTETRAIESTLNSDNQKLWNDQFTYPYELVFEQAKFNRVMLEVLCGHKVREEAKNRLCQFRKIAERGSKLDFFGSWQQPELTRRHHPIPEMTIFRF